ncbi:hypothetical protein GGI12_003180 [Dipsacomyces acuminosporus]|nr:hypothetical protein GGI12_003180 [Dipsacomyces acuminosporus]
MIPLYSKKQICAFLVSNLGVALVAFGFLMLTTSLLLGDGLSERMLDQIRAKTIRDLATSINFTSPIEQIIVLGDGRSEVKGRHKLCGGELWIDYLSESLNANLHSYAHGYSAVSEQAGYAKGRHGISKRKKRYMSDEGNSVATQVASILNEFRTPDYNSQSTLFVLVVSPRSNSHAQLTEGVNTLILNPHISARRILIIDTLSNGNSSNGNNSDSDKTNNGEMADSQSVVSGIINDPSLDILVYDSRGFLNRMQREHYKYGLRYPNHACIYNKIKRCNKPERFFWCDSSRVGSKAHLFLADDIVRKHFL